MRRDRSPTITAHADPRSGLPSHLLNRLRAEIEKISLRGAIYSSGVAKMKIAS